jgi:hypothetical protein
MKITIDTKEDSPEDIRKAIQLLSGLVEEKKHHPKNIFEEDSHAVEPAPSVFDTKSEGSVFGAMFESPKPEKKTRKGIDISDDIQIIDY